MQAALRSALERRLGSAVTRVEGVSGGDINQAHRATLADDRVLFVKSRARALPDLFAAEAHGLGWLAQAGALRVPEVIATSDGEDGAPPFLVLEWIERSRPGRDHDERLGRGLAALHRYSAPSFGLDRDNYLATLPQANDARPNWPTFYAERRLETLLARAMQQGHASSAMRSGFARLLPRMTEACGPAEPPARLHGDLWGGNALCDEHGAPVLIDPAVYGGHREIDLAMMKLFGGFSSRCFSAYHEAYPLAPGHEHRVALYQLYPLLAHVCLFGGGYVSQVERALSALI
ncbi:MAG: fructosamine kinase family protein [Polyangiales bacterium]